MSKLLSKTECIKRANIIFVCLFATAFFCLAPQVYSAAQDEIYVAGIPNMYPVEYYDYVSREYGGAVPQMLHGAARQAGLKIKYTGTPGRDERIELAKNMQVDMVCTYGLSEQQISAAGLTPGAELFSIYENGADTAVMLAYTKSMPENHIILLEQELAKYSSKDIESLLVQVSQTEYDKSAKEKNYLFIGTMCLILFILLETAVFLLLLIKKRQTDKMLMTDEVTGKSSYTAWKQKLKKCIKTETKERYLMVFMQTGMDKDAKLYGYDETTVMLKAVSDVIEGYTSKEKEGFARFRQSDFVIFMHYARVSGALKRLEQMHKVIKQSLAEVDGNYIVKLHTGVYKLNIADNDIEKAIYYSEIAKDSAKSNSKEIVIYDNEIERQTKAEYSMGNEIVRGLMGGEFKMYLQPIQQIDNGSICGAETLVRWHNPERGLLRPQDFIDTLKKKKLTGKMDMEVYRQGCKLMAELLHKEQRELSLLFNFTAEDVGKEGVATQIISAAQGYGLNCANIIIQLNHAVAEANSPELKNAIKMLRQKGFNVCLSELELDRVFFEFLECGVNTVKIRYELIKHVEETNGKAIVRNIVKLCKELGLGVVCVGVENKRQAEALYGLGCNFASGNYFYYPVNSDDFGELINKKIKEQPV